MKKEAAFVEYLTSTVSRRTGRALNTRSIRDIVSRCSRVERMLGLDLSVTLRSKNGVETVAAGIRENASKLGIVGKKPYYYNDFVSAIRRYHAFLSGDSQVRWSLAPKSAKSKKMQLAKA